MYIIQYRHLISAVTATKTRNMQRYVKHKTILTDLVLSQSLILIVDDGFESRVSN